MKAKNPARPEILSAKDHVVAQTAKELRQHTEGFISTAPLAEQRLLVDVLSSWRNAHCETERGLQASFEDVMGKPTDTPAGLTVELDGILALLATCLMGISPRVQQTAAAALAENCPELLAKSLRDRLPAAESESLRELAYQVAGVTNQAHAARRQRLQGPWDTNEQVDALVDEAIGPRAATEAVE